MEFSRFRIVLTLLGVTCLYLGQPSVIAGDHNSAGEAELLSPAGTIPIHLPTDPPHTPVPFGPWWWWHNLIAPLVPNTFLLPAGATTGPIPFGDAAIGWPWHIEFEIEASAGAIPAGRLVVTVPGGGWVRPFPGGIPAGANFTVAWPSPPEDANEIVWPEVPEVGAWNITYTNFFPATALGVDGGIAETDDPDGDQPVTPFDFTDDPPTGDDIVQIDIRRVPVYTCGDVDCSGYVDIDDVVYLVSHIFVGGPGPCDPDGDGVPDC